MLTSCTTVLTTSKIDWNSSHVLEAMLQTSVNMSVNLERPCSRMVLSLEQKTVLKSVAHTLQVHSRTLQSRPQLIPDWK